MIAEKLKAGDEIRVVSPSQSLAAADGKVCEEALAFLTRRGYRVTFSKNSREFIAETQSSRIESRVKDLKEAFLDPNVKGILAGIGGFNSNQILEYLDYSMILDHPKILCGFSDITALLNAVYTKTGLITYHGPNFVYFGYNEDRDYTMESFECCLSKAGNYEMVPSQEQGRYHVIQEGLAEGRAIGGNLCTLNLLQGTEFMPDLEGTVLFLEDDNIMGEYFSREFERNFQSLMQVKGAERIRGIVFGRFEDSCGMNREIISRMVRDLPKLRNVPVVFQADFGHVVPMSVFPVGGYVRVTAEDGNTQIEILEH